VHEVKSSSGPTKADEAQAIHYCYRLQGVGVPAEGAVLHYPKTRRTKRVWYGQREARQAEADVVEAVAIAELSSSPPRLSRTACRGCSFADYCWTD
jgi:CRISPR-associated exonuclease Cas4